MLSKSLQVSQQLWLVPVWREDFYGSDARMKQVPRT